MWRMQALPLNFTDHFERSNADSYDWSDSYTPPQMLSNVSYEKNIMLKTLKQQVSKFKRAQGSLLKALNS